MNDTTRTKRTIIIVASVLLVIIAAAIAFSVASQLNQPEPRKEPTEPVVVDPVDTTPEPTEGPNTTPEPPAKISDEDATQAIVKQSPELIASDGQPGFAITKSISPEPGWYIVTLKNSQSNTESARVILNNKNGTLTVVAGPATFFPMSIDLPDKVRKAIYK